MSDSPAILFWFYRSPEVAADRLSLLRWQNPGVPVFGLFGGPPKSLTTFRAAAKLLDDLWVHPATTGQWKWQHGDRMLARWHLERGQALSWESLFVHQWDLLLGEPVSRFALPLSDTLFLPGVRSLEEVCASWVWVQPWSTYYPEFQAFCAHPAAKGLSLSACVFVLATLPRPFLDAYAPLALQVPGMFEYRLPTLARALGYRFTDDGLCPDWEDRGDPLVNGCQREVTSEQVTRRVREGGRRVWHPFYRATPEVLRASHASVPRTVQSSVPLADSVGGRPSSWANMFLGSASAATDYRVAASAERQPVGIMLVPPVRASFTPGGSQVVARSMSQALAKVGYDVTVFCGTTEPRLVTWEDDGVRYVTAYAVNSDLLESGQPNVEYVPGAAHWIERCSTLFMIDRVFPLPREARAFLVLGATDYAFARTATLSPGWEELLVPSEQVREAVVGYLSDAGQSERAARVQLLPNPVLLEGLDKRMARRPPRSDGPVQLLFPHRADAGKGAESAVTLLARLADRRDVRLVVTVDRSATAAPGFYERLVALARQLGVERLLEFQPWQSHADMVGMYAAATVTLCLGEAREGFGLVCLESILAGTPVLARNVGAQTMLVPPGHGCFVVPADGLGQLVQAEALLTSQSLDVELARGAEFIGQHYSPQAFLARLRDLLS